MVDKIGYNLLYPFRKIIPFLSVKSVLEDGAFLIGICDVDMCDFLVYMFF